MNTNNIFSVSRFTNLVKRHYVLNYRGLLIAMFAIAGVLAIIGALSSIGSPVFNFKAFTVLFYVILFIAGYIFTSTIFNELHRPERSFHFLILPASSFEKLFNAWINTTVIYLVLSLITFYVSYLLSTLFALWWFDIPMVWLNIFEFEFLNISLVYILSQSVFFFGAIYFRAYNFLKTILALFVIFLVASMYQTLISAAAFRDVLFEVFQHKHLDEAITAPGLEEYMKTVFLPVIKVLGVYVLPVFFLVLSYLRFKEREV